MGLASWIKLGKQGAKAFSDNLAINIASNPDYAGLAITGLNARSSERQTAIAAEAKVRQAGMRALGNVKETRIGLDAKKEINDMKVSNFRKAGIIGALGTVAAGGVSAIQNNQAQKRADERGAAEQRRFEERMAYLKESNANMPKPPEVTPFKAEPFKWNGGSSSTSSTSGSSTTPQTLTGVRKEFADAIAGPESGSWGYEAFNQGGAAGGTKVLGKSGSHKEVFGRSLTDMTLGEIFKRQNGPKETHYQDGGLHAVGRYQFIGPTLRDEVDRMGLSHDTKFTPEIQDQIFFSHAKRIGNISPWIGPSVNYDASKRSYLNSLIPQL